MASYATTTDLDALERPKPSVLKRTGNSGRPPQGAECLDDGVEYRVWAPICRTVEVEVLGVDGERVRTLPMELGADGYARVFDPEGKAGDRYKLRLNREKSWPDPAARWQPEG